jgi:hypothetical protein
VRLLPHPPAGTHSWGASVTVLNIRRRLVAAAAILAACTGATLTLALVNERARLCLPALHGHFVTGHRPLPSAKAGAMALA